MSGGSVVERCLAPGPLFRFEDGTPLTRPALVRELQSALQAIGVDGSHYSGHSFRTGAATSAAASGRSRGFNNKDSRSLAKYSLCTVCTGASGTTRRGIVPAIRAITGWMSSPSWRPLLQHV